MCLIVIVDGKKNSGKKMNKWTIYYDSDDRDRSLIWPNPALVFSDLILHPDETVDLVKDSCGWVVTLHGRVVCVVSD